MYTPLLQNTPWRTLSIATGVAWAALVVGYFETARVMGIEVAMWTAALFFIGALLIAGGAALTFRSQYQLVPDAAHLVAALLLGVIDAALLVLLFVFFAVFGAGLFAAAFYLLLGTILSCVVCRTFHTKRLSKVSIASVLVALAAWAVFSAGAVFAPSQIAGVTIAVVMFLRALFMFVSNVDVLSPWVMMFWRGVVLLLVSVGLGVAGYYAGVASLAEIPYLPLYSVALFSLLGIAEVVHIFFRHKMRMARDGLIADKESLSQAVMFGLIFLVAFMMGAIEGPYAIAGALMALAAHYLAEKGGAILKRAGPLGRA